MASVHVKFRKSTIAGKAGSIYYQISHKRKVGYLSTGIKLYPEQWDETRQNVSSKMDQDMQIQHRIDSEIACIKRIICQLENSCMAYEPADIIRQFRTSVQRVMVLDYMQQQIEYLILCRRYGTAKNYQRAKNSLSAYCHGVDFPIQGLTDCFVAGYNEYLRRRGIVRNSISFYMRILRSVYNKAVRDRVIEQSNPFKKVYTGVDKTRKRAVSEEVIIKMFHLDLHESTSLSLTRDLFIFSYCTRGMSFVDMAYLSKNDIRNGVICYTRRKTNQRLYVRIEPHVQEIINRYANASPVYVFPILKTEDTAKAFSQYLVALSYYNKRLKWLSSMLGLDCGLSFYAARHSWATAARNHNFPLSVISAGMGHTSERTTQIYLAMLENSVIDSANSQIVSALK